MKKIIPLSLMALSILSAQETNLESIKVESTYITDVAKKAQTSADVADALSSQVPSIDMNRRSGIANDIIIRGQKRDNISVEVDGTKVCGACPNRMDPPVSHVLASQIQDIEVIEGPYDVETFGVMSGGVKIKTKAPKKGFQSEVNLGAGSFGYLKAGATASGGNDFIRALVSVSHEKSDQYEDGDGNTMAEQVENSPVAGTATFQDKYKDTEAYTKQSAKVKLFVNPMENHELRISATANRSDDILYPNSKMDARYDDSNIYSVEYNIDDLSNMYQNLNVQYYYSDVDHPMDTMYRDSGADSYKTNQLETSMQGIKLKNTIMIDSYEVLVGLDSSTRTWEGEMFETNTTTGVEGMHMTSLPNTETKNAAIFAKLKKSFGDLDVKVGLRYDTTDIAVDSATLQDNDYTALNANIVANYNLSEKSKMFFGYGKASRVPDARELYITMMGNEVGTPDLDQTTNNQVDLGYERKSDSYNVKVKAFYSMLSDYIYYDKHSMPMMTHMFKNIDATIYGAEFITNYFPMDELELSLAMSYKKGQKDEALSATYTDKDLADIAPLRTILAAKYEYMTDSVATLELHRSEKWSDYDADNGEQELDAWNILNLKVDHKFSKMVNLIVGVNNILDETYAISNTYVDLTLLTNGTDIMLLNEPGRYLYTNLNLKF